MKLKKVKIIVEPIEQTKKRWLKALKGKIKESPDEEIITVASLEVLGRIFSPPRLQILALVLDKKPKSIAELARLMKKDFKNTHTDVYFLADVGLIELKEKGMAKRQLTPVAKYQGIELLFAA